MNILYQIAPNLEALGSELVKCIGQTFQMLIISGVIAFVLGLFLGVLLIVTKSDGIMANPVLYKILDKIIDVIRSIPFIILMVLLTCKPCPGGNRFRRYRFLCGTDCWNSSILCQTD